jgi:hypothetical protein
VSSRLRSFSCWRWLRLFQPPQAEYLLLASSEEARALSPFVDDDDIGGGSAVPPERQTALDVAIEQQFARGWTFDASVWRRRVTDVGDPNVFFGTTVTVPNSVARQHASGFDIRLAARPARSWSGSIGYSHARVIQFGPVTGGLFLEDEVAAIQDGTRFVPDHDQRHGAGRDGHLHQRAPSEILSAARTSAQGGESVWRCALDLVLPFTITVMYSGVEAPAPQGARRENTGSI